MMQGIYTAYTGAQASMQSVNTISNNLVNSQTTGFKSDMVAAQSYGQHEVINAETGEVVGTSCYGVQTGDMYTNLAQGAFKMTGKPSDLAINGESYFLVQSADGQTYMTRDGNFFVDEEGYMVNSQGMRYQGENGPIQVNSSNIVVEPDGAVYADGEYVDTLAFATPTDPTAMKKASGNLFTGDYTVEPIEGEVVQGALEVSNVDVGTEMSNLIASQRSYQTCAEIISMMDQVYAKSTNEVGKL